MLLPGFRSEVVLDHFNGAVKFPSPSINANDHFNPFLQECLNREKRYGSKGQPLGEEKILEKSTTEKGRHISLFHRRRQLPAQKLTSKVFNCLFEGCGQTFNSQPSLSRHQTSKGHGERDQVKEKLQKQKSPTKQKKNLKQRFSIADILRRAEPDKEENIHITAIEQGHNEAESQPESQMQLRKKMSVQQR